LIRIIINTIYAGTGDLNFGSFSMGSQGILKSTDAGATWTVLGADVFGMIYSNLRGNIRSTIAVGQSSVWIRTTATSVVAGTKQGVYFSYDAVCTNGRPMFYQRLQHAAPGCYRTGAKQLGGTTRIIAAIRHSRVRHDRANMIWGTMGPMPL
jgi:hypothetical protein